MNRPTTEEQDAKAVELVAATPGIDAGAVAKALGVGRNPAANRLFDLFSRGLLFRVKMRVSFRYYATEELAAAGQRQLDKEIERGMLVRPIGEVAGFGTSALKKRVRTKVAFEPGKVDTSKAKVTSVAAPRGRYDPEPGFKGEFSREWEKRRRA
jgi:DNA-binding Lrp family transcriptional regulator